MEITTGQGCVGAYMAAIDVDVAVLEGCNAQIGKISRAAKVHLQKFQGHPTCQRI